MLMRKSLLGVLLLILVPGPGCSLKKYAINKIGDTLASGNSVYESDEDIELVGAALPFGLKLMESLLAESPNHRGLLVSACQGFVLYSYAYVDYEAQLAKTRISIAPESCGPARASFTCELSDTACAA